MVAPPDDTKPGRVDISSLGVKEVAGKSSTCFQLLLFYPNLRLLISFIFESCIIFLLTIIAIELTMLKYYIEIPETTS